jgi:hypothetical protein
MVVGIARIAPGPSSNWDRGPALLKKLATRRIVATALAAPKMAAPGMRLALVHLVGLRNRLFAFLDVAEKAGDGNMISRIAQLHHNLEVTGKLLGDPWHRPRGAQHPDHAGFRPVEGRAGRGASSLPAPAIEPRPIIVTARDGWSRMVPSPLRPRGQEQAQLLVRAVALPRPSAAVRLDGPLPQRASFSWQPVSISSTVSPPAR